MLGRRHRQIVESFVLDAGWGLMGFKGFRGREVAWRGVGVVWYGGEYDGVLEGFVEGIVGGGTGGWL